MWEVFDPIPSIPGDVAHRSRHHQRNDMALRGMCAYVATARELAWAVLRNRRILGTHLVLYDLELFTQEHQTVRWLFWIYLVRFMVLYDKLRFNRRKQAREFGSMAAHHHADLA